MIAYCNLYVAVYLNVDNILYMAGYNIFQPSAPSTQTDTVFAISCVVLHAEHLLMHVLNVM